MSRYILQPSESPGYFVCTDTENGIVCVFEAGNFNDNQKFSVLDERQTVASALASAAREMGDWLVENHPDKLWKK